MCFGFSTVSRFATTTLAALLLGACLFPSFAFADEPSVLTVSATPKQIALKEVRELRRILNRPDEMIDLARAKFAIDKMVDPTVDVEVNLRKIEIMVAAIKAMPDFGVSNADRLNAVRRYIYEPGPWNANQPYQYDFDDPLGKNPSNKLLTHYLASKKGNCVTMPLLFIILTQRLGLEVTAASAPAHILVKARLEANGHWFNIEATEGGFPARDAFYRARLYMTDQAIANGVYLRPLSKKETVALMATILAEHHQHQDDPESLIAVLDLMLEYNPKNVSAMIRKANAYVDLIDKCFKPKYPSPVQISEVEKAHYRYLVKTSTSWISKALALGWREPTLGDEEKYLQSVQEAKRKRSINGGT